MAGSVRNTRIGRRYDPVRSNIQPNGSGPTAADAIMLVAARLRIAPRWSRG